MASGWISKFAVAFKACFAAARQESSFWVHLPMTVAVVAVAAFLQVELWRWAVLTIVIASVLAAELFNTAIERLVQVLHPDHDKRIGEALDLGAAGVLVLSIGAIIVGLLTLGPPLWNLLLN